MPEIIKVKKVKELTKLKYLEALPSLRSEHAQKLTSIIFTMVAISLFGIFAINPTISTIVRLKKQLSDNRFVKQSLVEKIKNISSLQEQYTQIQDDTSYILDAIPNNPKSPLLMAQIQSVAKETNITLSNLQNMTVELFKKDTDKKTPYYSYSFSISGNGSFQDIVSFLSKIVTMQRVVNIDSFSVDQTADKNALLRFSLQGTAFYKI